MSKLFVDCDDTLVLWPKDATRPDGLFSGDKYELNRDLIGFVNCMLDEHREYELVIWSGGGVSYAQRWAEMAFPERNWSIAAKDMRMPEGEDICIDDMHGELRPRDSRVRVYAPDVGQCPICCP